MLMNHTYKARMDKVITYIETHLNRSITLAEVADVSHFSEFHFHRIFKGIMDETLNDYISRRRLQRAANSLAFSHDLSITEIALDHGFSSSANFSKAVKLYFGYSPSQLRDPSKVNAKESKIGKLESKYGKVFSPSDLYPTHITDDVMPHNQNDESKNMKVEIKTLETQTVCKLASDGGYQEAAIYRAWDKLIQLAQLKGIKADDQLRFAHCYDNPTVTPIDKCRYEASIVMPSKGDLKVETPYTLGEIPAGNYAVLYYKGTAEEALQKQLALYSQWFPQSGYEPDDYPMMEHYLNDVRADGFLEMEIYIKIKSL